MFHEPEITVDQSQPNLNQPKSISKIIALWGFSEATLGGILHAFNIPFTGLFVGGVAILLISLIAYLSSDKSSIIKITLIVITIKGVVSPHTPLTAYFAVFLQGVTAQLIFNLVKNIRLASLIFGIVAMLLSGLQKLIILTLVFGNTLWDSIDIYSSFVVNEIFSGNESQTTYSFSLMIMGFYVGIHLVAGIFFGYIAGKLPRWIDETQKSDNYLSLLNEIEVIKNNHNGKKKRKSWWKKKSGIIFILMMTAMLILSYLYPEFGKGNVSKVAVMILRSTIIMVVWFFLLGPVLIKAFHKYLHKQQKSYSAEITGIIELFPYIRSIVKSSWESAKTLKGSKKYKKFINTTIILLLLLDSSS